MHNPFASGCASSHSVTAPSRSAKSSMSKTAARSISSSGGEEIEKKGSESGRVQDGCDKAISRTVATAPAAVGEHDQSRAHLWNHEMTNEADGSDLHDHFFVSNRRVGGSRRHRWGNCPGGCPLKELHHLLVRGLREVPVELADGKERLGGREADKFVCCLRERGERRPRSNGHRENHARRAMGPDHLASGPRRRPRSDAVIDHHRSPAEEGRTRTIAPKDA